MNGRKAKHIRKKVYGKEDFRERKEKQIKVKSWIMPDKSIFDVYTTVSDFRRTTYQRLKRMAVHVPIKEI